jgi:predicted GNAT family acetyltransferase
MQIVKYEGDYDRPEFYSLMGKFFAEPEYKKELPYLANREETVWFIAIGKNEVVGFVAVNETNSLLKLSHDYVVKEWRQQGLYDELNQHRFDYIKGKNKPLEIVVKEPFLISYWQNKGFKIARTSGAYSYLRKEDSQCK